MIRKYFNHLIFLYVCLSTIFYVPFFGNSVDQAVAFGYNSQEFFVRFGAILIFALSLFLKPLKAGDFRVFASFLIYMILISMVTGFDVHARRTILNVGVMLLFYKTVVEHLDINNIKAFAWWIFGVLALNGLWMVLQYLNIDPLYTNVSGVDFETNEKCIGFLKLKANVGVFGALAGVVLALINPWLSILAVPFMWLGNTSATIAAFSVSMLFVLFFRLKRWQFFVAMFLILLAAMLYITNFDMAQGQFGERFKIWGLSIKTALGSNPITGVGVGKFSVFNFHTFQGESKVTIAWIWAHNEYIQAFFETGIVGLGLIFLFLGRQIVDFIGYREIKEAQVLFAVVLCMALICLCHFPFHVGKFAALCTFLLALFHARTR